MIVDTPHGEFKINDISRKQRREFYKKVKSAYSAKELDKLHDLQDEFAMLAFGDDKQTDKALEGLSVVQEDEVLTNIIGAYMGLNLGNSIGD
jgi:hypothetical protein